MAKSQNPMDAFRRKQKKKELKKHQKERQKDKQAKLSELDVDEIRDRIKKLERQVQQNPADGPTRKRKQELEDTLNAALKKQKAMEEEQTQQEDTSQASMTLSDLNAANRERYQNPENSIYYHPVLNPFGAPPPGRPQMYRVPPPTPAVRQPPAPRPQHAHPSNESRSGASRPAHSSSRRPAPAAGPAKSRRPGKRPPLPSGPLPPGTIQIPRRPPLPGSGVTAQRAPPSPIAAVRQAAMAPPPPPPPQQPAATVADVDMDARGSCDEGMDRMSGNGPARHPLDDGSDEDEEERREKQARLRSLMPMTLRVQRRPPPHRALATPLSTLPRPPPPPSVPGPPLIVSAVASQPPREATHSVAETTSSSVSSEFDAFMEEMKGLGAV